MNPYRLINSVELGQLYTQFSAPLDYWNQQYCLHPLTLKISIPTEEYINSHTCYVEGNDGQLLACISDDFYRVINYSLFGQEDSCFNSCSEELFILLLKQLFTTDSYLLNSRKQEVNWLYPGSTCLLVTLHCHSSSILMLLNPTWVHQNLALHKKCERGIISLDEALGEESLTLNLELCSMNLSIKQLVDLQIGDLISTDHKQTSPLQLMHEKKTYATAELGKKDDNKSIIIKEFL
jgi:hypothetical protein